MAGNRCDLPVRGDEPARVSARDSDRTQECRPQGRAPQGCFARLRRQGVVLLIVRRQGQTADSPPRCDESSVLRVTWAWCQRVGSDPSYLPTGLDSQDEFASTATATGGGAGMGGTRVFHTRIAL